MHTATLKWATPDGDQLIGHMARVSNPNAEPDEDVTRLISFLIKHRHWSPFEMCNMCVEIITTRAIAHQILRHRSFSFQEFSQRYAAVDSSEVVEHEMRLKGSTNRQGSLAERNEMSEGWAHAHAMGMFGIYQKLLEEGVAPECARAVLPEGYAPTRMYMNGTVRSWIHYCHERTQPGVQREHQKVALDIANILCENFPTVAEAAGIREVTLHHGA